MARRPGGREARRDGRRAPPTAPAPVREGEIVFGLRAGLAVLATRRDEILRVAHAREVRGEIGELGRFCTARSIPIVELPEGELARVAETPHHEGLVVMARPRRWVALAALG